MREALGSPHVDSRPSGVLDPDQARILARPDLSVPVWDIENAGTVLVFDTDLVEEAPIVDLRVRKARRRRGAKVVVASSHPTTLDANADAGRSASRRAARGARCSDLVENGNEHLAEAGLS